MADEREQGARLLTQVSLTSGVSAEDILEWPSENLQPYLDEMTAQPERGERDIVRRGIVMDRIVTLMKASPMPDGMTIQEGVAQGFLSRENLNAAGTVTDEEIDQEMGLVRGGS